MTPAGRGRRLFTAVRVSDAHATGALDSRALVAGMLAILMFATAACSGSIAERSLPALALEQADGGTRDLATPTSVPQVINLWATWCAPCREELPDFDEVYRSAEGSVDIIGVNVGDRPEAARELIAELGLTFPQLLDEDSAINSQLAIVAMPSTIFARPDGTVIQIHAGQLDAPELADKIAELHDVEIILP